MSWRILSSSNRRLERLFFKAVRGKHTAVLLTEAELKQLSQLQTGPVFADVLESFRTWCSKPPKGFEKFFKDKPGVKKDAAPKPAAEGEAPKQKPKASPPKSRARVDPPKKAGASPENPLQELFKKNFGGGSGGGQGMGDEDKKKMAQMVGLGLVTILGLTLLSQGRYKEISWKEFVETHLSRGNVERLEDRKSVV